MQISQCAPGDEIFAHQCPATGTIRVFNATTALRAALVGDPNAEKLLVPYDEDFAKVIRERRGVEEERLASMPPEKLSWPILCVEMEDDTSLIIDGHHRYLLLGLRGDKELRMLRWKRGTWDKFLVEGIPEDIAKKLLPEGTFS